MTTFPSSAPTRRRRLTTLITAALACGLLGLSPTPASAEPWPGHPGRNVVRHTVVPGDTATGLAVRYHAWTAELLALNGLGRHEVLHVGEVVRIPVVTSRVRGKPPRLTPHDRKMRRAGWQLWKLPRRTVKRIIVREAQRQGVPVRLALAVGWQESGWHQPVVSVDSAIGVMQLLPSSGEWMEQYLEREINLRNTRQNIRAGVRMLKVLLDNTSSTRMAVAAYYQGLAGVRRHGMYDDTRAYVASVMALRHRVADLP